MRKFLLVLLFPLSLIFAADDPRKSFLLAYYNGDYEHAHELLSRAFSDSVTLQLWDERIHLHHALDGCKFVSKQTSSSRALALLQIGYTEKAKATFTEDWLSYLGRATLSLWQNDPAATRQFIHKAMLLAPQRPEVQFSAGNVAESDDEALDHFSQFLKQSTEDDPLKKTSAEQAIDFIKKTKGLKLNESSVKVLPCGIESKYKNNRVIIRSQVDGAKDLRLLVDTGAGGLSFSETQVKPKITSDLMMIGFGKNQVSAGSRAVYDQFSAGDFSLRNAVAVLTPRLESSEIDGVAGSIIFSDYAILLPLQQDRKVVLFASPKGTTTPDLDKYGFHFSSSITFPFYRVSKMIIVKGKIKKSDEQMDFLIDTGAQTSVISSATAKEYAHIDYPQTERYRKKRSLMGIGGFVEDSLIADNVDIELGPIKKYFKRIYALNLNQISEALELEVDMILGQDFLEGYTLLIDYRNNRITFLR